MGRYLFVCHDAGGTVPPVLAVTAELVDRGHAVAILSQPSVETRARAVGCSVFRFSETPDYRRDVELEQQLELTLPALVGPTTGIDLLAASTDFGADVVVVDPNLSGALAAAESVAAPSAVLLHSLFKTFVDVWFGELWALLAEPVNATRDQFGVEGAASWADMLVRHELIVSPVPAEFDAPVDAPPPGLRHVGFVVPSAPVDTPIALPAGDDPVVAVSLSTTYQGQVAVVDAVFDALADEPVRLVATTAGYTPNSHPNNAVVADWVPHQALFGHVDAVITHGGLGTVAAALDAGVPIVCLPGARDQPLNASRAATLGVGITCSASIDGDELRTAVQQLLADPSYRTCASNIVASSARAGGVQMAATQIESLAL
jgi:MGT family glycosyltransferase